MGFFSRLRTGWALSMDSLDVVRDEPSLALFPAIAGVAGAIYLALILGGAFLLTGPDPGVLMYNASEVFHGRDPTMGEGLAAAWRNRSSLFAWAVISAIVGVVLRAIESADNPLADIAAIIFSVAWSVLTYFIVPVIVFEEVSVREMFERSGQTFKQTWGETAGATFGVGIVTVLFTLAGLAVAVAIFLVLGGTAVGLFGALAVGVLAVLFGYLLGTTLSSVARAALYMYATEGEQPPGFEDVDFASAGR